MRTQWACGLAAGAVAALGAASAWAGIANGTFNSGLDNWTVTGDVGTLDIGGDPAAVFGEGAASAISSIQQQFTVGGLDTLLLFDYYIETDGQFTGTALRDALTARLLDPADSSPMLSTTGRQDYFYHQVPDDPAPAVLLFEASLVDRAPVDDIAGRGDWYRVAVDLTSLRGSTVLFEVGLLTGDNGQASFALVDNILVENAIPAPAALVLGALGLAGVLRRRVG